MSYRPSKATPTSEQWTAVTSDEVVKLIGSSLCKSCQLDTAPTWLVKEMRELLSPFISLLFNKSLASCCYPSEFKKAVVRPLLKKHGLDVSQMKNYRPVSNLPFLSKLLERIAQRAASQLVTWPTRHTVKSSHCISQLVTRLTRQSTRRRHRN